MCRPLRSSIPSIIILVLFIISFKPCHSSLQIQNLAATINSLTQNQESNNFFFKPSEVSSDRDYVDYVEEDYDNSDYLDYGNRVRMEIKSIEAQEDPLIQVFKVKLMQLLGVDSIPEPSGVNNLQANQFPEAIYKQQMLLQQNKEKSYKRVKNRKVLKHRFRLTHSRRLRSKVEEPHDEDEHIRFNSSITKQITLVTDKVEDSDFMDNAWCTQITHNAYYERLTPLNCFKFKLDNEAFKTSDVHSAKLYLKLNTEAINQIITKPLFMLQAAAYMNRTAYLYVEANGFLIKRIDLTKINDLKKDYSFKHVEIKRILQEILESDEYEGLRIRLLSGNDLIQLSESVWALKTLFEKMDESIALNVKFGELVRDISVRGKRDLYGGKAVPRVNYKTTRDCSDLKQMGYSSSNYTCCRETLSVTMEQLGWSHWILSPKVIEYKYCRGGCTTDIAPRYENTHIIYRMFELSNTIEASHCCNIYDYEAPITFIFGQPPNFQTKMISLNAKNCLCS